VRELGLREDLLALRRRDSEPSLSRQRAHVQPTFGILLTRSSQDGKPHR
jgi:hypothetical protein